VTARQSPRECEHWHGRNADEDADDERQALVQLAAACILLAETLSALSFADVRLRAARERAGIAA
jgi:hypothetical protein